MKSLIESIRDSRGYQNSEIVIKVKQGLDDDRNIKEMAKRHNVPFKTMKDIFRKVKEAINNDDNYEDDPLEDILSGNYTKSNMDIDGWAEDSGISREDMDEIISDMSKWMLKIIK